MHTKFGTTLLFLCPPNFINFLNFYTKFVAPPFFIKLQYTSFTITSSYVHLLRQLFLILKFRLLHSDRGDILTETLFFDFYEYVKFNIYIRLQNCT